MHVHVQNGFLGPICLHRYEYHSPNISLQVTSTTFIDNSRYKIVVCLGNHSQSFLGTACATLCASLSCLLGASRVIHAVGKDNLFGLVFRPLNWEYGPSRNPVISVLFTSFVVALFFFVPSLNQIAQVSRLISDYHFLKIGNSGVFSKLALSVK